MTKQWKIKSLLSSTSDFERLICEIVINNDDVGFISQEIENGPVNIVLSEEGIKNIPKDILDKAIEQAREHLVGDESPPFQTLYKIIE